MADPLAQIPNRSSSPDAGRDFIRVSVAVTVAWTLGLLCYYAQAQLLGELMETYGRGEADVGGLFSVENTAFSATIIAAAWPLARLSRSRVAITGGFLVAGACAVSAFVPSFEMLFAARAAAGIGSGLISASGTAAAASHRDPDRVFAVVTVASGILFAVEPKIIPYAIVPYGAMGGYLLLAGLTIAMVPFLVWLLSPTGEPEEGSGLLRLLLAAPNRSLALIAMGGLFVFEIGQAGVWTFIARIGEAAGLDQYAVGDVLFVTGLLGLSGGLLAATLGARFGRRWPIAIGLALNAAAAAGLALDVGPTAYWSANLAWNVAYNFVVPYLMGALASLDDRGRWVVAADGAWNGGTAAGPWIGGLLVQAGGYQPLATLALLAGGLCMVLIVGVLTRFESRTGAGEATGGGEVIDASG